jgi:hypothetical protein
MSQRIFISYVMPCWWCHVNADHRYRPLPSNISLPVRTKVICGIIPSPPCIHKSTFRLFLCLCIKAIDNKRLPQLVFQNTLRYISRPIWIKEFVLWDLCINLSLETMKERRSLFPVYRYGKDSARLSRFCIWKVITLFLCIKAIGNKRLPRLVFQNTLRYISRLIVSRRFTIKHFPVLYPEEQFVIYRPADASRWFVIKHFPILCLARDTLRYIACLYASM